METVVIRIEVVSKFLDTRAAARKKSLQESGFLLEDLFLADVYTIAKKLPKEKLPEIAEMLSIPTTQRFDIKVNSNTKFRNSKQIQNSNDKNSKRLKNSDFEHSEIISDLGFRASNFDFDWAIEIGFLPGVTDNVAHTAREEIEDFLKVKFVPKEGVYTSQITYIKGKLTKSQVEEIASSLYNPLIQRAHVKSFSQYKKEGGMDFIVPRVVLNKKPRVLDVNLDVSDQELTKIGKEGVKNPDGTRNGPLALNLLYMKTIQTYFKELGRAPTDIELESIAQTWSEHCKHTIFANPLDEIQDGIFKHYIKRATEEIRKRKSTVIARSETTKQSQKGKIASLPSVARNDKSANGDFCVSVFTDNSGAIAFDDDYLITHKVETHNTPSSLDPFGGAVTGIVGVNRDTLGFGLGAKPVANFYGFCVADPRLDIPLYKGRDKTQKMLSSKRIFEGIIAGVYAGGNQSGIPTPQGFVYFDEGYRGKPLVFAGTVGLIPRKVNGKLSHIKKAKPGDYIVMIGGRVGKDGIHGATFSSEALSEGSPVTAVQIGDPITQKKFSDALIYEVRDMGLYNSITDNGAGGLSCSVAEMAKESGGCIVDLEKVPLKYPGLEPWEIWVSESQERMTLAVPSKNWKKFNDLMKRRGVEATVIGKFTDSGNCVVKYNGKTIMDLDMEFLHNGLPKENQKSKHVQRKIFQTTFREPKNLTKVVSEMLARPSITSYSFISEQYDHIVQAGLVLPPLQGRGRVNATTSVFRPVLASKKGVIMSQGLYPLYSELDPYHMAASCIDTAVRNIVAAGGNPDYIAILDNFCWCSSDDPKRLWQLAQAARACYDYAVVYGTPFISGKDSMFNDFAGYDKNGKAIKISILPTLLISSIGVIDNVTNVVSLDSKNPGDLVYILGETHDETGGSEYASLMKNGESGEVPKVDSTKNNVLYHVFYTAIQKGIISSSISLIHGGLAVALAKKAIGGMFGLDVNLKALPGNVSRDDFALFSESQGRILVTIAPENKKEFEKVMSGRAIAKIGEVTKEPKLVIKGLRGKTLVEDSIKHLTVSYRKTFSGY